MPPINLFFVNADPRAEPRSAQSVRYAVGGLNITRVSSPDEPASTCFFNLSAAEASAAQNSSAAPGHCRQLLPF